MQEVSLTETENRYFCDLFLCCDEEKTGKIPMLKASELFRSANLTNEKILEITSLAGIPDTALHVSRVQFYSCFKLIAANQATIPLRQELIAASVQLPLPRFSWKDSPLNKMKLANSFHPHHHAIPPYPVIDQKNSLKRLYESSEPNISGLRRNSSTNSQPEIAPTNSDVPSTDSEVEQGESSCGGEENIASVSGHNKVVLQFHWRLRKQKSKQLAWFYWIWFLPKYSNKKYNVYFYETGETANIKLKTSFC